MTQNPRRGDVFFLHRSHLEKVANLAEGQGLEIGAMDLPYVSASEGHCEFADYRTTEELQDLARVVPGHFPEHVAPVAYNLKNGYGAIEKQFDYVIASHVIEHIPNLLGWLRELERLTKSNGVVFLVVPDRRYTFDYHRRETTISDLVECDRLGLERPSFYHVFDHHFYTHYSIPPHDIWSGSKPPPPLKNYANAREAAERTFAGFEDAHCSVFTPESFQSLFADLLFAKLTNFAIGSIRETQFGQLDFTVALHKKG